MSQDKLELLTDSELHNRLLRCGFPNVPVTETTRKILINKLRNFMKRNMAVQKNICLNQYHKVERVLTKNPSLPAREDLLRRTEIMCNASNLNKRQKAEILYELPPILSGSSSEFRDVNERESNFSNKMSGNIRVVNKLLKLREKTINQKLSNKPSSFDSLASVSGKQNESTKISHWLNSIITIKHKFSNRGFKQTVIPYILIISLIMFLLTISVVYLIQQPSKDAIIVYELCYENLSNNQDCVNKEILGRGLEISKLLQNTLSESAKSFKCNDDILPTISYTEVLNKNKFSIAELQAAEHLIEKNPQWNIVIEATAAKCDEIDNSNCVALSLKSKNFKLVDRKLQIKCSMYRKIHRFFIVIGCFSIFALFFFITIYSVKFLKVMRMQKKETVNKIINEITNSLLVSTTAQSSEDPPEIILNHLRDQMFPLTQRKNIMKPWNEAIKLLEENDSRVCFGSAFINGEICRTIKWNAGREANIDIFTKKWNSPAFDNTNRVLDPPTPCLKIRHMFDNSEANKPNLKEALYGAILEKIDKNCQILDFQIDKQTCCVYIRCASEKDAGIIHKEINGWWFDKRLVSIKFLHLDRYLTRFPTPALRRNQD